MKKSLGKSLKFYRDIVFKASVTGDKETPVIVFFNNEGSKLELFPLEELAKDINEENPPELSKGGFSGVTLAYNAKSEPEVDEILPLDGYHWEVVYGPNWKFDDSDMLIIE